MSDSKLQADTMVQLFAHQVVFLTERASSCLASSIAVLLEFFVFLPRSTSSQWRPVQSVICVMFGLHLS